jgi:hypothetical protein
MKYLPCKVNEAGNKNEAGETAEETGPGAGTPEPLPPETIACLPELKKHLEQTFLPQWQEIHRHLFLDEIEDWAAKIKTLGEKYDYPPLLCWCNRLLSHIEAFDMGKLPVTLQTFPGILNTIESNIKTSGK